MGATHDRPEAERKHAAGTRTFDQAAVEAVGQAEALLSDVSRSTSRGVQ
ncbi:MAG: hypothetical protein HQ477_06940 [Chloroflexi bacterium]|nr:hypothetical protein [Chloroflexota bacterium]